jgi:hypothetical protein
MDVAFRYHHISLVPAAKILDQAETFPVNPHFPQWAVGQTIGIRPNMLCRRRRLGSGIARREAGFFRRNAAINEVIQVYA